MANRSYLYTCDREPGGKTFHARGLSEYGWDIPLVHKVMAAGSPRVVRSAIWEMDIGIVADWSGAAERTIALFDKIADGKLAKRADFDTQLAEMKAFLGATPAAKYVLLEGGEIYDIQDDGDEIEEHPKLLVAEIEKLAPKIDRAIAGKEDKWLAELRAKWSERAHPGYWSDVLYFDFPPPKKAKVKPKPATKKSAAKKQPTTSKGR